jgi:hypothetical protein
MNELVLAKKAADWRRLKALERGRFGEGRYATMFYGEFDSESKILRYVNAGHSLPNTYLRGRRSDCASGRRSAGGFVSRGSI